MGVYLWERSPTAKDVPTHPIAVTDRSYRQADGRLFVGAVSDRER
jgi:hypothetical protein